MSLLLKIYYVIFVYVGFADFGLSQAVIDILAIGFIFLSVLEEKMQLKLPKKEFKYYLSCVLIPAIVIFLYSIITQLLLEFSFDYLKNTFTICFRFILYTFCGVRAAYVFKTRVMNVLLFSCIVAYIPALIQYFIKSGLIYGIVYLFKDDAYAEQIALEVHRLTYVFGFIAFYFFYQKFAYKQKVMPEFIVSFILMLIGMKRIALFASVIVIIAFFVLKFFKQKNISKILSVASVFIIFVALGYIYLIKSGLLQQMFNKYAIGDSFRFNFWNYISKKYEFSPTFLGYGISYSRRMMWHEWSNIEGLGEITNIHNDVLGYYVGLGFIGFILFWIMYFLIQFRLIKKSFSLRAATFCFLLSFYYFIIMATSNEGLPGFIYGFYFTAIIATITADKAENINEVSA